MSKMILVIPDVHAGLDGDNERLGKLGRLITKRRPDSIICLGDFADMYSLSGYDSALSKAEIIGDYWEEADAVQTALDELFDPLYKLQRKQRRGKKKIYQPNTVLTLGNHDAGRYARVVEKDPIVLGRAISWEDLGYQDHFNTIVPFKEFWEEDEIFFTHHMTSMMGRAIGGSINPARNILNVAKRSIVVGHSHIYDYAIATDVSGRRIHGLVAGCFVGDQKFEYAKGSQHNWVDGISILNNVSDGDFDLEFISRRRIMKEY